MTPSLIAWAKGLPGRARTSRLLARGLDLPLAGRPVGVGLRIVRDTVEELRPCRLRRDGTSRRRPASARRRLERWRTRTRARRRRPRGIDDAAGEDRLAPRLGFDDDADDRVAVHHRRHELPVEHRVDAGLLDEPIGDELEALGIESRTTATGSRAPRLPSPWRAPRTRGRCRRPRPSLMPVPGEALDADDGDIAAETAEALDQRHLHTRASRSQRAAGPPEPSRRRAHRLADDLRLFAAPAYRILMAVRSRKARLTSTSLSITIRPRAARRPPAARARPRRRGDRPRPARGPVGPANVPSSAPACRPC